MSASILRVRVALAGTSVLLVGLMSGCAVASDEQLPGIDASTAAKDYFREAENWELAPGWSWPEDPGYTDVGDQGENYLYGPNIGKVDAVLYWYCSWGRAALGATDETEREAAAAELLRLPDTPLYQLGFPEEDRGYYDTMLDSMREGDFTRLTESISQNCPTGPEQQ